MGFAPTLLDAVLTLNSSLAFLEGSPNSAPYGLVLLDVALMGILVPVGLFLVVCGIIIAFLATRPPRPRAFRLSLAGAGINLAAGLLLGVLNLSAFLLPAEYLTVGFLQNAAIAVFAAEVAAAVGLLLALFGIALIVYEGSTTRPEDMTRAVRMRRGKSIYRDAPSAR
jgi:hypothetical protein